MIQLVPHQLFDGYVLPRFRVRPVLGGGWQKQAGPRIPEPLGLGLHQSLLKTVNIVVRPRTSAAIKN